jgi:hypothetical protein
MTVQPLAPFKGHMVRFRLSLQSVIQVNLPSLIHHHSLVALIRFVLITTIQKKLVVLQLTDCDCYRHGRRVLHRRSAPLIAFRRAHFHHPVAAGAVHGDCCHLQAHMVVRSDLYWGYQMGWRWVVIYVL